MANVYCAQCDDIHAADLHDGEKLYVACRQCGEVFDDLANANGHTGSCGSEQGWDIVTEEEAF